MNPLATKLVSGALISLAIGCPAIHFSIDSLTPRTIKEQLEKDGLKIIEDNDSAKWSEKVSNKTEENLKKFIKEHKNSSLDTVNDTDLKDACKSALRKKTNETNYDQFKQYCSTPK